MAIAVTFNRKLLLPILLLAVLLGAFLYFGTDDTTDPDTMVSDNKGTPETNKEKSRKSKQPVPPPPSPPTKVTKKDALPDHPGPLKKDIDTYLEWAKYPPRSRPLLPTMVDVIDHHLPIRNTMPVITEATRKGTRDAFHENTAYVDFRGSQTMLGPGDPLVTTLSVWQGRRNHEQPIGLREVIGQIRRQHRDLKGGILLQAEYNDAGYNGDEYAGDGVYTNTSYLRDELLEGHQGNLTLKVQFIFDGLDASGLSEETAGTAVFRFHYLGNPPLTFTGQFHEEIVDGSLIIVAEAQVHEAGWFKLRGLLFDADGGPVAYYTFDDDLALTDNAVPFQFFGKILREHGKGGPYTLRRLDGFLFKEREAPPWDQVFPLVDAYTTQAYNASDFSDKEWESPKKDRRLRMLKKLNKAGLSP